VVDVLDGVLVGSRSLDRSCRGGDGGVQIWHRWGLVAVMIVGAVVRWWWWLGDEVTIDVA
jgi:hypothetical protein